MMPGYNASTKDINAVHNRVSFTIGLGTQSLTDKSAEETPDRFDLETAEQFGQRVAETTLRWVRGKA